MDKIQTYVKLHSLLSRDNSSMENWTEYVEWLNDICYKELMGVSNKFTYTSPLFGELIVVIFFDDIFDDRDGKATIYARINADSIDEDKWYDHGQEDKELWQRIAQAIDDTVNEANDKLSAIKYPVDEELIFMREHLYMRIEPYNAQHTPQFESLSIETSVDPDELFDNLDIW